MILAELDKLALFLFSKSGGIPTICIDSRAYTALELELGIKDRDIVSEGYVRYIGQIYYKIGRVDK